MTDDVFKDILRIQNQLAAQYDNMLSESLKHALGEYNAMAKLLQESLAPFHEQLRETQALFASYSKELATLANLSFQEAIGAQNALIEAFSKLDMDQIVAVVPSEVAIPVRDMSLDVINQIDVENIDDEYIAESQTRTKEKLIKGELLTWGNIIALITLLATILMALATAQPKVVNETHINQLIIIESITLEGLENLSE